ncbi:major facilitator superfamily domain-containing protein [Choanephora cucurbitarum]|nr:major facilitator superfamily domain-containing protein [Choanephora cucurbitarum]
MDNTKVSYMEAATIDRANQSNEYSDKSNRVLQDYYEQHVFGKSGSSVVRLSLVGTFGNFALNAFSPVAQVLVSYFGTKTSVIIATFLSTSGLLLASQSSQVWHLIISQGLVFGAGGSIIFYIGMSSIQQSFSEHRRSGIALGIATSGSCMGGLIMPFVMTAINRQFGITVCYWVLGGLTCLLYMISCFLFKNVTEDKISENHSLSTIELDILKSPSFLLWCTADIVIELSYYTPLFFLPSYATYLGLSDTQGSCLISVTASCNAIGRILSGHAADHIGHINTIILTCLFAGLSAFFIWTFAYSFPLLVLFSIVFGFFGGAFVTLSPSTTAIVTGMDKFRSGYSIFLFVTVVAMFGPNFAGIIEASVQQEPFLVYKIFTGTGYLVGAGIMIALKWRLCGSFTMLLKKL